MAFGADFQPAFKPVQLHHTLGNAIMSLEKSNADTLIDRVKRVVGARLLVLAQVFVFAADAVANAGLALRGKHSIRYLKASGLCLLKIASLPFALVLTKLYRPTFQGESSTHLVIEDGEQGLREVNKQELTRRFLEAKYPDLSEEQQRAFAKDKDVQHVLSMYLNPYKESNPTMEEWEERVTRLDSASFSAAQADTDAGDFADQLRADLDNLGVRKVEFSKEWMQENLVPGDILICRYFHGTKKGLIDGTIYALQSVHEAGVDGKREKEITRNGHFAIYVGDGKVAEASIGGGHDVRVIDAEHEEVCLEKGDNFEWVVVRPKDPQLAQAASDFARGYADSEESVEENGGHTAAKYSFLTALRALYHNTLFRSGAKGLFIKTYFDNIRGQEHARQTFRGTRGFYCSEFVAYCLQAAEANRVLPGIIAEEDCPRFGARDISAGLRARRMARRYASQLDEQVQLQYDAKWMTPVKLRQFIVQHPELFEDVARMIPPADQHEESRERDFFTELAAVVQGRVRQPE